MRAIYTLHDMPLRCVIAPESEELNVELRQLVYRSHRIIFRVVTNNRIVQVLRVYHRAREPLRLNDLS